MNIPSKIRIGKTWYRVIFDSSTLRQGHMGLVNYEDRTIKLADASNTTGRPFKQREVEDTFWHEVVHAILHDMKHTLRDNERFVIEFTKRLTSAINSARF